MPPETIVSVAIPVWRSVVRVSSAVVYPIPIVTKLHRLLKESGKKRAGPDSNIPTANAFPPVPIVFLSRHGGSRPETRVRGAGG